MFTAGYLDISNLQNLGLNLSLQADYYYGLLGSCLL